MHSTQPLRILVAGGAGFIGSHTAKCLQSAGYEPLILDNLSTGNRFSLRFGKFVEGNISDTALVSRLLSDTPAAGAILFAANAYVGESTSNPAKYYTNNISASLAFIECLRAANINALVFSSSCSIYGLSGGNVLITEDTPKDPLSPYAESKLFLEQILRWYDSAYGFCSARLRYFNAAGADPDGVLGEWHTPETHLIPLAIQAALGGPPLRVFGTDYPTPDGTAIRDYIHVSDLASAHILALEHLLTHRTSLAVNLGTGIGSSVRQVIAMVEQVSGLPVPVEFVSRRTGDAPSLVADASLALATLAWKPQHSSLSSIVKSAWRWYAEIQPGLASASGGLQYQRNDASPKPR